MKKQEWSQKPSKLNRSTLFACLLSEF
jgi:hypothetical protein